MIVAYTRVVGMTKSTERNNYLYFIYDLLRMSYLGLKSCVDGEFDPSILCDCIDRLNSLSPVLKNVADKADCLQCFWFSLESCGNLDILVIESAILASSSKTPVSASDVSYFKFNHGNGHLLFGTPEMDGGTEGPFLIFPQRPHS